MLWFIVLTSLVLVIVGIVALVATEARMEVKPASALVYSNIWTGEVGAILAGTGFIVPGFHKILEKEVSLRNEAENPSNVKLITRDGIELEVDYIVRRLQVGYPDMDRHGPPNPILLKEAVVKAVKGVNYKNRRDLILTRIVAHLQHAFGERTYPELFSGGDLKTGKVGEVNKGTMKAIEEAVNASLVTDIVTKDWGFWVEMDLEDYNLPATLREAREASSSAEMAGKALHDKAKAAGIDPRWLVIGDALADIFGRKK